MSIPKRRGVGSANPTESPGLAWANLGVAVGRPVRRRFIISPFTTKTTIHYDFSSTGLSKSAYGLLLLLILVSCSTLSVS
jgi:hypothetical protein